MTAFCIITLLVFLASASTFGIEVSTSLGDVRGTSLKSRLGKEFYAFRGIPYANPPKGDLRFRNPEPVSSWKPEVLDATEGNVKCPDNQDTSVSQQEDCLHLNVFSKNLSVNALKPVIVYIHGGALVVKPNEAKPNSLMDRDVVLVTFNYRLGALGFLATGTADAPGNAGFKDQVLALKWVKNHIQNFGGDPKSVTLLGYDAGGLGVGLHLVSPMSKGLFHKAIAMSSALFGYPKIPRDQFDLAKKQAKLVNCPTNTTDAMMKCLKEIPFEEISKTCDHLSTEALFTFLPVIETEFGQERFIIEEPIDSLQTGRFHRVPLIIGMSKFPLDKTVSRNRRDTFNFKLIIQNIPKGEAVLKQYEMNQKDIFGSDSKPSEAEMLKLIMFDSVVGFPIHRFAHLAARYVPVYYYRFSFREPQYTLELEYLLPYANSNRAEVDGSMTERLTRMWTQFAQSGNPNNATDEYLKNLNWEPLALNKDNYLDIGDELVMKEGLYLERFDIWEKIHPLDWTGQGLENSANDDKYPEPKNME